jgi:chitin disaccharide deacetylase
MNYISTNIFKMSSPILVITADDLGYSQSVNDAIFRSLQKGYINSASLMVNTQGFENAVLEIIKENLYDKIGVHVNLTEGAPLTKNYFGHFVDTNNNWNRNSITKLRYHLPKDFKISFSNEICAQIEKVISQGFNPSHISSHHHVHTLPCFFPLFLSIAKRYNIKLRLAQGYNENNYLKYLYRSYINQKVKTSGLNFTDAFTTISSFKKLINKGRGNTIEIMVHPVLNDTCNIIDKISKKSLEAELNSIQ